MEMQDGVLHLDSFLAVTLGIVVLFFSLESTLSAGYARAFENAFDPRDEVMVSLKILR